MSEKKKAMFLCDNPGNVERVYSPETQDKLHRLFKLHDTVITKNALDENAEIAREVEYILSTWGMPSLGKDEIENYFPKLKAVLYGAGSVQAFARPFLESGIKVFSAWGANSIPVVEYTVAQIILANKGFFSCVFLKNDRKAAHDAFAHFNGNFGEKVGILGLGMIGREVARRLRDYRLEVLYYDPFFPSESEEALGVHRASLEEIFSTCGVVTNHIANLPATVGMLNYSLFSRMRPNAVFINTGRGAQVIEKDLVKALQEEQGRKALLDVTFPEPPEAGHAFYSLPNVILTPHIAGSSGKECFRMGEYMAEEAELLLSDMPTRWEVSLKMLETMA